MAVVERASKFALDKPDSSVAATLRACVDVRRPIWVVVSVLSCVLLTAPICTAVSAPSCVDSSDANWVSVSPPICVAVIAARRELSRLSSWVVVSAPTCWLFSAKSWLTSSATLLRMAEIWLVDMPRNCVEFSVDTCV